MEKWLFSPPFVFIIIFIVIVLLNKLLKPLAFKGSRPQEGARESYACGEADYTAAARPDYSTFFAYAFFFTLAHVAALVMTTVPKETLEILAMACIYIVTVAISLYILLRREG